MTCIYCHNTIKDGAKFCRFCGKTQIADSGINPSAPVPQWSPETAATVLMKENNPVIETEDITSDPNAIICPFCFTENASGAKVCRYCAKEIPGAFRPAVSAHPPVPPAALQSPVPPVVQAPAQAPPAAVVICPHCKKTVPAGAKFCSHCGKAPWIEQTAKTAGKKRKAVAISLSSVAAVLVIALVLQLTGIVQILNFSSNKDPDISVNSDKTTDGDSDDPGDNTNPEEPVQQLSEEERREKLMTNAISNYIEFYQTYLISINTGDFNNLNYCTEDVRTYLINRYNNNSTYSFVLDYIYLELDTIRNGSDDSFFCTFKNETTATNKISGELTTNQAIYTVELRLYEGTNQYYVNWINREKDGGVDKYNFSSNFSVVFSREWY